MVDVPTAIILVEKFRNRTDVRVLSQFPSRQRAEEIRSGIKFVGKRGQPFIIPVSEIPAFRKKHEVRQVVVTPVEQAADIRRAKEQEVFERQREQAKQPTEKGRVARAILRTKFGIQVKERVRPTTRVEFIRSIEARQKAVAAQERIQRLSAKIEAARVKSVTATRREEFATRLFERQGFTVVPTGKGVRAFKPEIEIVTAGAEVVTARGPRIGDRLKFQPVFKEGLGTGKPKVGMPLILFKGKKLFERVGVKVKEVVGPTIVVPAAFAVSQFLKTEAIVAKVTGKLPTTKQDIFKTDGTALESFIKKGAVITKEDSILTRLRKTSFNISLLTGKGFGKTFEFARKKPLQFLGTVAVFEVGLAVGGRVVTAFTGLGLRPAKSIVGTVALAGFLGIKEVQEPGSVRTLPGAIATTTEFGTFVGGAKFVTTGVKVGRVVLDRRFIPFVKTSPEKIPGVIDTGPTKPPPPSIKPGEIPIFIGGTRTGTVAEQALKKEVTIPQQFFTTTATTPRGFFGGRTTRFLKDILGRDISFEVKEPLPKEVGAERAKFKEFGLFLSRGEAFTVFGETAVGRLGTAEVRGGTVLKRTGRFLSPKRIVELLRTAKPTILRFPQEQAQRFPPRLESKIREGQFGSRLRRLLGQFVKQPSQVGKVIPGTRTSGLGTGELEFIIPVGSKVFLLEGPTKTTFSPNLGRFVRVVDVGLKPGKAPEVPFNLKQRLINVVDISLQEVLGIRTFGIRGLEKGKAMKVIPKAKKEIPFRPLEKVAVRSVLRPKDLSRELSRIRDVARERQIERELERTRQRERARDRTRERIREVTRERIIERPRERVTLREVAREVTRERPREREIERLRERLRLRDRTVERVRDRIRERPRVGEPPPPPPGRLLFPSRLGRGVTKKAFRTQIRRGQRKGDRFVTVKGNTLPRNRAINLGAGIADSTTAASFRLMRKGTTTLPDDPRFNLKAKFRGIKGKSKLPPRTFVERRRFRIDTPGEKQGIPFSPERLPRLREAIERKRQRRIRRALPPGRLPRSLRTGRGRVSVFL